MPKKPLYEGQVEILEKVILHKAKSMRLVSIKERHVNFKGQMTSAFEWSAMQRKSGVAVLIHNVATNEILIIEQLRPAVLVPHGVDFDTVEIRNAHVLEVVAGGLNPGEDSEECARREAIEEVGIFLPELVYISRFFLSPGGTNEDIYLYYAPVASFDKVSEGGGLEEDNEDIKVHIIPLVVAKEMMELGEFEDAKTIIAIQWLLLKNK